MAKYLSGREKKLNIGITSYTENQTILDVTGNANISGIATVGGISITGELYDSNNQVGTTTSILVSTGTGVTWTSVETVSLQGRQGTQGLQGFQGFEGDQGIQGLQGIEGQTPESTVYLPNSISMEPGVGSYSSGTLSGIQTYGDYTTGGFYGLYDTSTTPGYDVRIGFTSVTQFNRISANINYQGNSSHTVELDLYNWNTSSWETFQTFTGLGTFTTFQPGVIDSTPFINAGIVSARVYHLSGGLPSHYTQIDYFALEDSLAGGQGPRGIQGTRGQQGTQGLQGNQGIQGLQGSGSQGTQGTDGIQGSSAANVGKIFYLDTTDLSDVSTYDKALAYPSTSGISSVTTALSGSTISFVEQFITEPNVPRAEDLPEGQSSINIYSKVSSGSATLTLELYKASSTGTNLTLISTAVSPIFSNTNVGVVNWSYVVPSPVALNLSDRLVFKLYATRVSGPNNITVDVFYEGTTQSNVQTTLSSGSIGNQGTQGLSNQGTQGLQGLQGRQGTQGLKGDQGTQGLQGLKGDQGTQGTQGLKGDQGTQGLKGDQGAQGLQGLKGDQGTQGLQGLKGDQGTQGLQGLKGDQGTQGTQGLTGPVAGSANQVVYKDGSNNPTGSSNLTFDGSLLTTTQLSVIGNVSIGGTLTYEDVTNIDAIGLVTARSGVRITTGGLIVTSGVSTFGSNIELDAGLVDIFGNVGTASSVLLSTGSGVKWESISTAALQGVQGLQGLKGDQGTQGLQGLQGRQGTQGLKGDQGTQGTQGTQGLKGDQGTQGLQGLKGDQGTQGLQGLKGDQGTQGIKGDQGTQGLQGLKGDQGTQGTQGLQGLKGDQGTQGLQGLKGDQGTQGTQGLKGDQGTQGLQGLQGLQGIKGDQGTQGLQGLKGDQGTQGLQGLKGDQGTQGLQGLQGLQGIKGDQGTQGLQGLKGDQGTQGLQGIQGTQGLQGRQGTQGIQGQQGTQGLIGPVAGIDKQIIFNNNNVSAGATNFVYDATNQRVGIGTTIPTASLDVNGTLRLRSALYDTNNSNGTAGQVLVSTESGIDWVDAAPASAISGITVRDETNLVGSAGSITTIDFVGIGVTTTLTSGSYATVNVSGIATTIVGGTAGNILYQSASGVTNFVSNGISGQVLVSNGTGSPTWQAAAPASAISGITVTDEGGSAVGGGIGAINKIDVVGNNITATGIGSTATITLSNSPTFNALTVTGNTQLNGNLNVDGIISVAGTSVQLNTQQLTISDSDIVLGIGTSFSPTDNTANHGGIAIASTEGTPLVDLNIVPNEVLPSTYKKIMWFKGSSIGAGITDAWLFNYAVGIGSTQVPNGIRLAVGGVHITDNTIRTSQLSVSGLSTFSGNLRLNSGLTDFYGNIGVGGSILISTGTGVSWTTPFAAGIQGLQGTQGRQGTQGQQGTQGLQGLQGLSNQGVQGQQGTQGLQGIQGISNQGAQGLQGTQGLQGVQGLSNQGVQGLQGRQGTQGLQGVQGLSNQGVQGQQGTQGLQGVQGLSNQGVQGQQGTQGVQGLQGFSNQGVQGQQGTQGLQGLQGLSNQGVQGQQGTQGVQGLQGLQGFSNQGVQGQQGTQGLQGVQGLSNQGVQGQQGTQGLQGVQGFSNQGVQGLQGLQGRQGVQGISNQGVQGLQATQGVQGVAGTVAGTDGQVIYNNGGAAGGASNLNYDDTNNRVGIGTSSPQFLADVAGDIRITQTNKMRFGGTSTTTNFYIQYNSTTNSLDFVAG